jgi:predicted nucleic acid-binding protein
MGKEYLIDSNAISNYLGNKFPLKGMDFFDNVINDMPFISVINKIELLGQNRIDIKQFQISIEYCVVCSLSEKIVNKTIEIRRQKKIKLPDAIIAATAIINKLTLIIHNLSDFNKIPNLKLLDLHTLQ